MLQELGEFNPKEDEIGLYLTIFERQLKFLNIPESKWIPYLISSFPIEIAQLIAREDEEDSQDYRKIKELLFKRYRLTADRFRQLFSQHKKSPDTTWRDFYFEIASYFEGWIPELNIKDFELLKSLIVSDQIKKKTPPDLKEHFIDSWAEWNQPLELVEKLDAYENISHGL
ncbi:hypothetical protein AVEN_22758-1 [Araneus ventricosus]|uniref:SCAN box domain-containing protein n=1 Tax=Araneus ventricosus TaxID=182803 RepID=A0A4Y2W766_ARAVE|nr:hypothetical protein AVEN_22758-1 [Araneus ventricosus]